MHKVFDIKQKDRKRSASKMKINNKNLIKSRTINQCIKCGSKKGKS